MMKKCVSVVLALVMALALCSVSWADDGTITLDDFLKALNVTESTTSVTFDGASHEKAAGGKLTVKWSPVSGCFDSHHMLGADCPKTEATGNTPKRVNNGLAQFQLFTGRDISISIKNVNFVYVPADVKICINSGWKGVFTKDAAPSGQLFFENTGSFTITDCSFDNVALTTWNGNGTTAISGCTFKNVYNNYAIKDIAGKEVNITGNRFENCGGAIMTSSNSTLTNNVESVNISSNQFSNIDVAGTAPQEKVGTRGIIQIAAATKVTGETSITLDSNTAENCGPVLRQLNESVDMSKTSGNLSGLVNANGKLTATDDSKSAAGENGSKEIEVPYTPTPEKPSNNYYYYAPTTDTTETKGSPKTFDAGIALYVGMALTSAAGLAYTGKKRED